MARAIARFPQEAAADQGMACLWAWYLACGAVLLVFAVLAGFDLSAATVASVQLLGILVLVGALTQIAQAVQARRSSGFTAWLASGALYAAAGILVFINPLLMDAAQTLFLVVALVVAGLLRIWWSAWLKPLRGWGWIAFSGAVTVLAGLVFIFGWPEGSVWQLGMVLAVDLAVQGAAAIRFGLALREPPIMAGEDDASLGHAMD